MRIDDDSSGAVIRAAEIDAGNRPAVWVVRAKHGDEFADRFIAGGYVGVGWIDLQHAESRDEIRQLYKQAYPDSRPGQIANLTGQIVAFRLGMNQGDYVITPTSDGEFLRYGRITGPEISVADDDGCPDRNRRAVAWAVKALRVTDFGKSFERTLWTPKTVFQVRQPDEFLAAVDSLDWPSAALHIRSTHDSDDEHDIVKPHSPALEDKVSRTPSAADPDSGMEAEEEDPEQETTQRPFDPSKIKVRTVNVVVDQIVSRIRHREVDLQPDFQRLPGIWNLQQKSRLIESLLLRIPIPVFYVAADHDENWAVVDGVQRFSTIFDYMNGVFPLGHLEYRQEFNGKRYDVLPRPMQRRMSETPLVVNVIEPGTPPEVMFNIFRRINTGGIALNGQEIRHALNPGPVREYLKALAKSHEFLEATDSSIKSRRMADRECALRFLAFYVDPWEEYAAGSLDSHLQKTMQTVNAMSAERRRAVAAEFRKAMRTATHIFGNDAFRKRYSPDDSRRPISLALFEAWSVQFARCSPEQIERLSRRAGDLRVQFTALLNSDADFEKSISVSTATRQRIKKRFTAIHDLVHSFL